MPYKTIVPNSLSAEKAFGTPRAQRGVTLIELLVGITIGLLVVGVAMAAMMVSRTISGTVSDASTIQLQGSYAMRTIGAQLRQAGSLYLNPDPVGGAAADPLSAVIFETDAVPPSGLKFTQDMTVGGDAATGAISTAFRRYKDVIFTAATPTALARNCLGGPGDDSLDEAVESNFAFESSKNELRCTGNGNLQPIVQNVAEFQVTYMEQIFDPTGSSIKYVAAADVTDWRSVQGAQVCLVLYGDESIDLPSNGTATYIDCSGASVDMTTLTGKRKNRMHLAFRNTFQLRSQGLL